MQITSNWTIRFVVEPTQQHNSVDVSHSVLRGRMLHLQGVGAEPCHFWAPCRS